MPDRPLGRYSEHRNDVVHNNGIGGESANNVVLQWGLLEGQLIEISAEQMISLIDLFPYELRTAPTPQPSAGFKRAPGRLDARLSEDVKDGARKLGRSDNELNAVAYSSSLAASAAP